MTWWLSLAGVLLLIGCTWSITVVDVDVPEDPDEQKKGLPEQPTSEK